MYYAKLIFVDGVTPKQSGRDGWECQMRTASEMYDSEIKAPELPDSPASESHSDPKPEPVVAAKTEGEKPKVEEVAFDDDAETKPVDVSGYEKALDAARGDKRRAKKLWQEAKAKIVEEVAKARKEAEETAYQRAMQFVRPQAQASVSDAPTVPDLNDTNFFDPNEVKKYVAHMVKTGVDSVDAKWFQRNIAAARERHADFDEFETEFKKAIATNPQLGAQADNSPDPAEFAYRTGKTLREMQGVGTIDELRTKIAAEERAKILAEQGQPTPQSTPQTARPPLPKPSLAGSRGTGIGIQAAWAGPRSMTDILA